MILSKNFLTQCQKGINVSLIASRNLNRDTLEVKLVHAARLELRKTM